MMKRCLIIAGVLLLGACADEPGSVKWCDAMKDKPKTEWSAADASTFATKCLFDATTIGSGKWCEHLAEKPKGDWTADEAAAYARHCVM